MSAEFPIRLWPGTASATGGSAVVLVRCEEAQYHLGLLRAIEAPEPVLHFAWHRLLRDEPLRQVTSAPDDRTFPSAIVFLPIDPILDEALRFLARRVARKYANRFSPIAYGFGLTHAIFDPDTAEPINGDAAFTCATFVLAILRSVGIQLIDSRRWRIPTEEDLSWQRRIGASLVDWIEKHVHGDLPRAKERVEHDLGSLRFRPTDVAGAVFCDSKDWPVGVNDVETHANALEIKLPWHVATSK